MGFGGIDWDTDLGGSGRQFPSTCWSQFLDGGGDRAREAAETLAEGYWKPVYAYIRAKWAKSNEDAKDLTQDFFLWMMDSGFLSKADPARGRFRAFVKVSLDRYLGGEERKRRSLKRGGDLKRLPLEEAPVQLAGLGVADPSARSPEEALDRVWRNELLSRAAARLGTLLEQEGKEVHFRVFQDYHFRGGEGLTYKDLAQRRGITESDVINFLREARRRFRDVLADLVAQTVGSDQDLREELKQLFGGGPP